MAGVRAENITKQYDNFTAVNNVSVTFEEGQLTVLVGPSGCGKTTLLRMVAGLVDITAGTMRINDTIINDIPTWDRNIAMVFQNYALYPHMTVFQNMAFPLQAKKFSRQEIKLRVERTAESLGLAHLLKRKPRELSGGQMQRVAVGRAIVRRPDVFLMDEPLSNLDAKLRVDMRAELKHLQKELGITTIYVTHDQAEAMTMADKLVVMRNGKIQQEGDPEDLYLNPVNTFVGGFIGSPGMNFIPCNYSPEQKALVNDTFCYPLNDRMAASLHQKVKANLLLGVRPEDCIVSEAPLAHGIKAEVYVSEPMGRETLLTLELGGVMIKASAPPHTRPDIGAYVWLTFADDALRFFDATHEYVIRVDR